MLQRFRGLGLLKRFLGRVLRFKRLASGGDEAGTWHRFGQFCEQMRTRTRARAKG